MTKEDAVKRQEEVALGLAVWMGFGDAGEMEKSEVAMHLLKEAIEGFTEITGRKGMDWYRWIECLREKFCRDHGMDVKDLCEDWCAFTDEKKVLRLRVTGRRAEGKLSFYQACVGIGAETGEYYLDIDARIDGSQRAIRIPGKLKEEA